MLFKAKSDVTPDIDSISEASSNSHKKCLSKTTNHSTLYTCIRRLLFPKRLGIFQPNFTCLLCVPIYARLQIFIQLSATLTKLCHIKRDHPVHIMCAKCPPLAETHSGIF